MNRQPKLLGIDLGFGFTKCVDGEQTVIFQSHLRRRMMRPSETDATTDGIYRVALDKDDYVVGDDTADQSLFEGFARRPERLFNAYGRPLVLTAVAPFSEQECPLYIVLGLPVDHFQDWGSRLAERLTGYHKLGVYQSGSQCAHTNIHIRKVHIVPHPLGTFTSLIMGKDGGYRKSEYTDLKIALIDVGFRTTNIMVMNASRFCNRGSACIEMGMAAGLERMAGRLARETGYVPDLHRLYKAIRMGFIRVEDQEYNLKKLRRETYQLLSSNLADHINHALRDDWDIERVVLTGGGAADLAEDLAPLVHGDVVLIEHDPDARLGNVQGQLRLARHMWGASGFCETGE